MAWAFGMNRDQNDVAPDVIAGSAVINIPKIFVQTARAWQDGTLEGPLYTGLATGAVDFVPNPAQPGAVPQIVLVQIEEARRLIIEEKIEVPSIDFVEPAAGDPGAAGDPPSC